MTTVPVGLLGIQELLTLEEELKLLEKINASVWDSSLKRRVQHYGHRYKYRNAALTEPALAPPAPVPDWAKALFDRCAKGLAMDVELENLDLQVIVNEYVPGQGISAHIDDPRQFGEWVITVSLGSACEMLFERKKNSEKHAVVLAPRSAYAMTGESRFLWTHAIPARKSDVVNGKRVTRETRVSVTFRAFEA